MLSTWGATRGAAATPAAITTAEILGASALNPSAVADGGFGVGWIPNGWVAKLTMPYLVGASIDATKIRFLVTNPGYDTSRNVVTRSSWIRGSRVMRAQNQLTGSYSGGTNPEVLFQSNDGVTLTTYIALQPDLVNTALLAGNVGYGVGIVYQGSTISSLVADTGFYGAAQAGTFSGTVTNSSTRTYYKPEPAYFNTPFEWVNASTRSVEVAAYHRYGQQQQMIACAAVSGIDTTGNETAATIVSAPTLSTLQTQGPIAEVFAATYSLTALNQGETCRDHVKLYPWIGDSTAIMDSETYTASVQDPRRSMRFYNDKTGAYGGAIAVIEPTNGVDASGVVSLVLATAAAAPFKTFDGAADKIAPWNLANRTGHTAVTGDLGGATIYLSSAVTSSITADSITSVAGSAQTYVRQLPANVTPMVVTSAAARTIPSLFHFVGVDQTRTLAPAVWTGGVTTLTGEGHTFIMTGGSIASNFAASSSFVTGTNNIWLRNVTVTSNTTPTTPFAIAGTSTNGSNAVWNGLALGADQQHDCRAGNLSVALHRLSGELVRDQRQRSAAVDRWPDLREQ
jgi:hypothetical protein